jgi:hypothetical protein
MKRLTEWLRSACAELELRIELGYKITLPDMPELTAVARIHDLGAPNGMLIFSRYEHARKFAQKLLDSGFAFSILDEPSEHEQFDLQSFEEMFIDWGWSGDLGRRPSWIK